MHVRWSALQGMVVVDDETQDSVAFLTDPLIDADRGLILGFFVQMLLGTFSSPYFLSIHDILSVGTKVHIRSIDTLSPPVEIIRLQKHLEDPRQFLGQKISIRTSGKVLGRCSDVQFDTRHFLIEWLFPRRFFLFGQPIAASDIIEVTEKAIWIKEPMRDKKEKVVNDSKKLSGSLLSEVAPSV